MTPSSIDLFDVHRLTQVLICRDTNFDTDTNYVYVEIVDILVRENNLAQLPQKDTYKESSYRWTWEEGFHV